METKSENKRGVKRRRENKGTRIGNRFRMRTRNEIAKADGKKTRTQSPAASPLGEGTPQSSTVNNSSTVSSIEGELGGARKQLTFEGGTGINVSINLKGGEYDLNIKRTTISCSTAVERAKIMSESAGILLLQAEMLREMGDQLLSQSQALLQSVFIKLN